MKKSRTHSNNPLAVSRRGFLQTSAAGLGGALIGTGALGCSVSAEETAASTLLSRDIGPAPDSPLAAPPMDVVRIGFVGVGGMGSNHVRNLITIPGAQIKAVCDIRPEHAERAKTWITEAGQPEPTLYTRGETDFERMCEQEDLDLVYTATPWQWHVPVMLSAMKNGKHAATEVPAAMTIDDCWALVESAEKHRLHAVMMENCNYGQEELMVLNIIRQGLLGEILHAECGYLHDLRALKFSDTGEGLWRREWAKTHDANLYPTHGLGPVANYMNINRGDQFAYLVSMSSPSRGLQLYAQEHLPPDSPKRQEKYVLGDVSTSMIKTVNGRTIYVVNDTNLPRPYSRINMVQGTKGLFQGYPSRIHVEGRSEEHQWEPAENYRQEFEHPLWKDEVRNSSGIGHGGMDYLEDYRLIYCLRNGLPLDMTVYDAAALSAVVELSQMSVAEGSKPIDFPDFTRGKWKTYPRNDFTSA